MDILQFYTLILLAAALILLLSDKLWYSNHSWHLSKSHLLECKKCGNVFLSPRQQLDRRCPNCGQRAVTFRLPYSGIHETLKQRAKNTKQQ